MKIQCKLYPTDYRKINNFIIFLVFFLKSFPYLDINHERNFDAITIAREATNSATINRYSPA